MFTFDYTASAVTISRRSPCAFSWPLRTLHSSSCCDLCCWTTTLFGSLYMLLESTSGSEHSKLKTNANWPMICIHWKGFERNLKSFQLLVEQWNKHFLPCCCWLSSCCRNTEWRLSCSGETWRAVNTFKRTLHATGTHHPVQQCSWFGPFSASEPAVHSSKTGACVC